MVGRFAGIAALLFATSAVAAPQSFAIRSVSVTTDGAWHSDPNGQQTRAQCAKFRLPSKVALRWFKGSTEVTDRVWREELDWTQCSASGTLITGDGKRYPWRLDQSGRGQIIVTPAVSVYLKGPEIPFGGRK